MVLKPGARYDDDHQLVKERPELFDNEDPGADHHAAPQVGSVERATAAPGEQRVTPGTGPQGSGRVPKSGSGR